MPRNAVVRRFVAVIAVVVVAACSSACGGGGTTSPTTTSTVTTALPTQPFNNLPANGVAFADVTVNGTGVLTGVADWTFASNDIDIYVTATSCSAADVEDLLGGCTALGRTTAVTTKPERLTVDVRQGNYRVWVANFGPSADSGTLQLTATVAR